MAETIKSFFLRYAKAKFGTLEFGLINEVKFTIKPLDLGKDSYGRTVVAGYDVKGEFQIMSADNYSLRAILDSAATLGTNTLEFNGVGGKISVPSVLLIIDWEVNLAGKASALKCSFDRYFVAEELQALFSATPPTAEEKAALSVNEFVGE